MELPKTILNSKFIATYVWMLKSIPIVIINGLLCWAIIVAIETLIAPSQMKYLQTIYDGTPQSFVMAFFVICSAFHLHRHAATGEWWLPIRQLRSRYFWEYLVFLVFLSFILFSSILILTIACGFILMIPAVIARTAFPGPIGIFIAPRILAIPGLLLVSLFATILPNIAKNGVADLQDSFPDKMWGNYWNFVFIGMIVLVPSAMMIINSMPNKLDDLGPYSFGTTDIEILRSYLWRAAMIMPFAAISATYYQAVFGKPNSTSVAIDAHSDQTDVAKETAD